MAIDTVYYSPLDVIMTSKAGTINKNWDCISRNNNFYSTLKCAVLNVPRSDADVPEL